MNRELIIEKFKVLLASIFPIEAEEAVVEEVETVETVEVKLTEVTLEDGTIISYDVLKVDQPINVVNADGTFAPLIDGEYLINEMSVTVVAGIITEVKEEPIETEVPEPVTIVEPVVMEAAATEQDVDDLINGKVEELKLAYEAKLAAQKSEFEAKIAIMGNKFNEIGLVQAPVEENKAPLTYRELLAIDLAEKRKERLY